jgi:hypothetical protein
MGIFDTVKKILFDEDEIDDLPVRDDKKEEKEDKHDEGGVIFHNEEDTITEVKVPEEKPASLTFPVRDRDFEDTDKVDVREVQSRLREDEQNRTQEIERVRADMLTRTRDTVHTRPETLTRSHDDINEYREPIKPRHDIVEPVRETLNIPEKKEKGPYKVPPVISPVFGILDKNYDPSDYEETRQKITMTNSGSASNMSDRQFGPVSFNDKGLPQPKYKKTTIIVTETNSNDTLQEELKKELERQKESEKIEEEIINNILNTEVETKEDSFETKEIPVPQEEEVEEPVVEYNEPEEDAVIEGSPYDDMLESMDEEKEPTVDINELINNTPIEDTEEANIEVDAPKDIEENVNLDDTIETDLYNLIDSMYSDDE